MRQYPQKVVFIIAGQKIELASLGLGRKQKVTNAPWEKYLIYSHFTCKCVRKVVRSFVLGRTFNVAAFSIAKNHLNTWKKGHYINKQQLQSTR